MIPIIKEYRALKNNLGKIVDISGYRNDYIAAKIGMKSTQFAMKKKRNNWSDEEVERILNLLTSINEDVEDAILLETMISRKEEDVISLTEFKAETAKWK